MLFQINNTNVRLAGSIHRIPQRRPMPDWVEATYRWSTILYLEHDVEATLPLALLPAGQTIEHLLPPDVWQRLNAAWPERLGPLPSRKLWTIPPALALSEIALDPGVEPRLTQLAISEARHIRYLETPSEVASFFDSISNATYTAGINWVLDNPTAASPQIEAMYDAWIDGDIDRLSEIFSAAPLMRFQGVRQALVDGRNRLWVHRIVDLLQTTEPTMIAVGAGHLGGENGLLQLLAVAGQELRLLL
jgi:uncharacterized protein YbaP (TraB family)